MKNDHEPPYPLSRPARAIWDGHAARIHGEGRLARIDRDALARYAETYVIYRDLTDDVERHGVMIEGRQGMVKHPGLSALAACRDSLQRLARELPLYEATQRPSDSVDDLLADLGLADGADL